MSMIVHELQQHRPTWTVTVEPGEYFLGDPCYVYSHSTETWMELLNSTVREGTPDGHSFFYATPVGKAKDTEVLAFDTHWGDGSYPDQFGTCYAVDAGMIGLTPVSLIEFDESKGQTLEKKRAELEDLGKFVSFDHPTVCSVDEKGSMRFGHYRIHTD